MPDGRDWKDNEQAPTSRMARRELVIMSIMEEHDVIEKSMRMSLSRPVKWGKVFMVLPV